MAVAPDQPVRMLPVPTPAGLRAQFLDLDFAFRTLTAVATGVSEFRDKAWHVKESRSNCIICRPRSVWLERAGGNGWKMPNLAVLVNLPL